MAITTSPPTAHPITVACEQVRAAAATVNGPGHSCLWRLTGEEKLAVVEESLRARSTWDAAVAQMIGELERDQVSMAEYGVRTTAWLRSTRMMSLGTARREVTTGVALIGRFSATAAAMAAGEISHNQAAAILRTLDELPPDFSSEQIHAGEATLLGFAQQFDPQGLDRCASTLINTIAPEIAELKDAARLEQQERQAQRTNSYASQPMDTATCTSPARHPSPTARPSARSSRRSRKPTAPAPTSPRAVTCEPPTSVASTR